MTLHGTYYDAASSRAFEVILHLEEGSRLRIESAEINRSEPLQDCVLSDPLGRMARHFTLPDGARLEITEVESLAIWERQVGRSSRMHWVHLMETRWRWVAAAVTLMLGLIAGGYIWGLPIAAKSIALRLPPKVAEVTTAQARYLFTKMFSLSDSKLPVEQRQRISAQFQEMAAAMDPTTQHKYRLEFFSAAIPNAFALPDGLVCITDGLIEKAKSDQEIYGVLAHEIVHVREQHGLRSVIQNSTVFLIWTLMTGDISMVAGMGSALPATLAQSGYSRGFEKEADLGAADYLIQVGWGTKPLSDILRRIDPELHFSDAEEAISTHPLTKNRIKTLEDYEKSKRR